MPRISHLAAACALALSAQAAQAQQFSGVVSFGDSLSDAGNVSIINPGAIDGNSFTTNNDPVAAELIALYYNPGSPQAPSMIPGGTNYAWGGSCAQVATSGTTPPCVSQPIATANPNVFYFARLNQQISQHLNGGPADPNALYTVWSGANDIFASLGTVWATSPAIIGGTTGVANAVIANVNTLQNAGANYIVVFNLPDLARTPQFNTLPTANQQAGNLASVSYNGALNAGLAGRQGIIPVNVFALVNEAIANPAYFGFTNVTTAACIGGSSLVCGAVGSGNPINYAPGTNDTFLFADSVHPTGAAHRLLASVVTSTIAAPGQVSLAGELPVQVYGDHSGAINQALLSDKVSGGEAGSAPRGFFQAQFGNQDYDASLNSPALSTNSNSITAGFDYRYSEGLSFGAAISYGNSNGDFSGGDIDGKEILGSAFATAHFGNGYVNGILSLGSSSIDINRYIVLGPSVRVEEGNANASHKAFELSGGYLFGDAVRHGPFASVTWQKISVGDYAENSGTSTSMRFDGFDRDSLIGRVGYQLQGSFGDSPIHPSVRVAYASENQNDTTRVTAGSTSMNGQFTMDGFTPSDNWVEADLSVSVEFTDTINGYLGYHGRLSDDIQDNNSYNIGVNVAF